MVPYPRSGLGICGGVTVAVGDPRLGYEVEGGDRRDTALDRYIQS